MGMEYVYAALLLHKAGQKVEEAALSKVLEASGSKADPAMAKATVAALDGVDIEKAIKDSAVQQVAAAAPAAAEGAEKKEAKPEKSEDDKKKEEEAASAGLSSLFG
jgi:large subunit ribosomal protein L12